MNFCENCRLVFGLSACPQCGNKKLRAVKDDDYCFLTEQPAPQSAVVKEVLNENDIHCVALPSGDGFRTYLGLQLENEKIFVTFSCLEKANGLLLQLTDNETDYQRKFLLENADSLSVNSKLSKKLKKKLKIANDDELFDFIIKVINAADKIEDKGRIVNCLKGGHYIFCYSDLAILTVNSVTFGIIDLKLI